MRKPIAALIYDFDGTLSPGNMQEFGFISAIGQNNDEFWKMSNGMAKENDADGILCYMYLMLKEAEKNGINLTKQAFFDFGKKIKLYEGVKDWFKAVNEYGQSVGVEVKHFINSSGLREMIEGTPIAGEFESIFACSFLYENTGKAYWPAVAVNYTAKTQFLFKINKGIKQVSDSEKINEFIPEEERVIPFKNMIYIGDGQTDIPCMKMIKERGGQAIAVFKPGDTDCKSTAERLMREGRINFAFPANYSCDKSLFKLVKRIFDKIKADYEFQRLIAVNSKRYGK